MSDGAEDLIEPLLHDNQSENAVTPSRKRWLLGAVLLCLLVVNTTFSIAVPIFPQEAAKHGVGPFAVGMIFGSFSFVDFLASVAFGRMLQRQQITRRPTMVAGIVVLAIGTALFGFVARVHERQMFIAVCLVLRLIEGIACAAVDTSATAIIASLYRRSDYFGTIMGFVDCVLSLGWIVGPVIGASLASALSFGAPFFIVGAVALLFTPLAHFLLPASDFSAGSGSTERRTSPQTLVMYPPVAVLILTAGVAAASITWADPVLSPHLEAIGFSVPTIGVAFSVQSVIYGVMCPIAGWVNDKVGRLPVICVGLGFCGLGCLLLGPLPWLPVQPASHPAVWAAMLVLGFGAALAFTPITPALLEAASAKVGEEPGLEDLVSGIISGTFYLGCGAGPVLGGILASTRLGFAWTAAIFGVLMLVQAAVVTAVFMGMRCGFGSGATNREQDEEEATKLLLDGHHDSQRSMRGGLRAPSMYDSLDRPSSDRSS